MFNALSFVWPASFADINANNTGALSGAPGELQAAGQRLAEVPALSIANNPVAAACVGAAANFNALVDDLLAKVHVLCVHPWQQGVGQGDSHYRYLSPENAVLTAAKKFADLPDGKRPSGTLDALALVISADSFSVFADRLNQFNLVFPVADLQLCARRARQLSTLEHDKVQLPDAPVNALWRVRSAGSIARLKPAVSLLGEHCAHAMGYAQGGISPDDELLDLIQKKTSVLSDTATAINALAAQFAGAEGQGTYLQGRTPAQIRAALLNSGLGHNEPLACCLVLTGASGTLNIFAEMLGL